MSYNTATEDPQQVAPSAAATVPAPDGNRRSPGSASSVAQHDPLWRIVVPSAGVFIAIVAITVIGGIFDPDGFVEAKWIFACGGFAAVIASGTVFQMLLHRRQDRQRTRKHLDAIESLTQIAAALTAVPGSAMSVLDQLGTEIQRVMGMPIGTIQLLDEDGTAMRGVYCCGINLPEGVAFPMNKLSGARKCFETGEVLFASDVRRNPDAFNTSLTDRFGVRSLLMLPMIVNHRPVGVILLGDRVPRHFTDLELRMARLWGTQAAVIVIQNRLYEQLRGQVVTNQTLLRELNHRVKNNLAGIVGLLAVEHPDLSANARHWLDRVATRVQTMARTHDLFTGRTESVQIRELVDRIIDSLRPIKPPGVSVETDLSGLIVPLTTDRAVTLAMVLHELCYNSIIHGVGTDGSLCVRGSMSGDNRILIDVIDERGENGHHNAADNDNNGNGSATGAFASHTPTGLGLTLVKGLVGRELRGRLSMQRNPQGGTTATVEFPLDVFRAPTATLPPTEDTTYDRTK